MSHSDARTKQSRFSAPIRHVRRNGVAYIALFFALTTAPATALIITGEMIADESVTWRDLAPNSVGNSELAIEELDAHDAFTAECNPPGELQFTNCASVTFTAGQPMEVMAVWTYGFRNAFDTDNTWVGSQGGDCRTTFDGTDLSGNMPHSLIHFSDPSDPLFFDVGATPVVDVIPVSAGSHTLGLRCRQEPVPFAAEETDDFRLQQLRIAVVELEFDGGTN